MYGYIYRTTNIINNKIYTGQHRSRVFDPNYLGSGKLLLEAIKKYGRENFKVSMIEACYNFKELNEKEIFYIDKFKSKVTYGNYNISDGGFVPRLSGPLNWMYGRHIPKPEWLKKQISEKLKGHPPTGPKFHTEQTKRKISNYSKNQVHTKDRDERVSNHHKGSKMMTNGTEQKWVYAEDIEKILNEGWWVGSCKKRKEKRIIVVKEQEEIEIPISKLKKYREMGYEWKIYLSR